MVFVPNDGKRFGPDGNVLASWVRTKMTHYIKTLEEHGDEIVQVGIDTVQARIDEMDRIADPHRENDGPESMREGVTGRVTPKADDKVTISVGWDLTQYRNGYPELQDEGFMNGSTAIVGMEALSLARIAMKTAIQRTIQNDRG